jgi:hypothetical protein
VNQDFDPDYNFAVLQTYSILPVTAASGMNELDAKRVAEALRTELAAIGYRESDDPNIHVAMHMGTQQNTQIDSYGYGYGGWGGRGMGGVDVYQYTSGTLVIDFVDVPSQSLVWRGTATAVLDDNPSMDKKVANINQAVAKILAQYPPR